MTHSTTTASRVTIGIDVGDTESTFCVLSPGGRVVEKGSLATTSKGFRNHFESRNPSLVVLEAGAHSRWISSLLGKLDHEVVVANPRRLALILRLRRSRKPGGSCLVWRGDDKQLTTQTRTATSPPLD